MFGFGRDNIGTFHFTDWFNNMASLSLKFLTKAKANHGLLNPCIKLNPHTLLTAIFSVHLMQEFNPPEGCQNISTGYRRMGDERGGWHSTRCTISISNHRWVTA